MSNRGKGPSRHRKFQKRLNNAGPTRKENHKMKKSTNDQQHYIVSAKLSSEFEALTKFLNKNIKQNYEFGNFSAISSHQSKTHCYQFLETNTKESQNPNCETKEIIIEQFKIKIQVNYDRY